MIAFTISATVAYLILGYLSIFRIAFDVLWNPSNYPDGFGGGVFLCFLFMALPCIFSFILCSRKTKILRQDAFFYLGGVIFCIIFQKTSDNAPFKYQDVAFLLKTIGFITVYTTIFGIYQLYKLNSKKQK